MSELNDSCGISGISTQETKYIRRARGGDIEAFGWLCERYRHRIWRVVVNVARSRDDADDLTQAAMLNAFRALPSFVGDANFEAWLCRIALNAARDFQKSAWRRRVSFWSARQPVNSSGWNSSSGSPASSEVTGAGSSPSAQMEAARRETQWQVRQAVARLKAAERIPIWLIYFEQFTVAEVARLEGCPDSTIRSRVKQGLRRLAIPLRDLSFPDADDDLTFSNDDPSSEAKSYGPTELPNTTMTSCLPHLKERRSV